MQDGLVCFDGCIVAVNMVVVRLIMMNGIVYVGSLIYALSVMVRLVILGGVVS